MGKMKSGGCYWYCLILLLLVLTACSHGGGGSSNNDLINFKPLQVDGNAYTGNLSMSQDDFFSFSGTAGKTYTVLVETQSGNTALVVAADAKGNQVIGNNANNGTPTNWVTFVADNTQTYFLQVYALSTSVYRVSVITGALNNPPNTNYPPEIVSMTLSPYEPHTNDDLVLSYYPYDADNDPLTETIAWSKNGVILDGETTTSLTSSHYQKGDTISVTVTLSDGTNTVSQTQEVVIADSPPVVNFVPPTGPIASGTTVSLPLNATDLDGDPFTYQLLYGPAGMTVDVAGNLHWTADQVGYFPEYTVHWAVRVTSGVSSVDYTDSLSIFNPKRAAPIARSGIFIPYHGNGLAAGDFDHDGKTELLVTDNDQGLYTLEYDGTNYVQDWMYPFELAPPQAIGAITTGDINSDGWDDFIVGVGAGNYNSTPQAGIQIIDGATRRVIAKKDIDGANVVAVDLADMDGDGTREIVALVETNTSYDTPTKLLVLNAATLATIWDSGAEALGNSMAIGNFDTSPTLEIATSNGYVYGLAAGVYTNLWLSSGFGGQVAAGDIDGDGVDEIIGLNAGVSVYSLATKSLRWSLADSTSNQAYVAIHVANIDNDPEDEIIVGEAQWGDIVSISYDSMSDTLMEDWRITSENHGVSSIISADLDNDGAIEVAWASGSTSSGADSLVVAGFNPGVTVEWANLTSYPTVSTNIPQLDGPFIGGYWINEQPGQSRALFVTPQTDGGHDGSRLITLDAANGAMQISSEIGSNSNTQIALNVADYDGDGSDEIFAAMKTRDSYLGYFTVYDFLTNTNEWSSPANQGVGTAVGTGDLNGDGAADFVVATTDGYLRAYDILNQTLIWSNNGTPASAQDVEVADVDGDGTPEIIAAIDNKNVVIYEKSTSGYTQRNIATVNGVYDIAISDVDGDGKLEIAAIAGGSPSSLGQVVLLDSTLTQIAGFTTDPGLNAVFFDDSTSDVKLILSYSDNIYFSSNNHLAWVDPMTGAEIYRSPALLGIVQKNSLHLADTNGNGQDELIFATNRAMYITQ